jgi:predicted metal-dependent peptidase
MDTKEKEKTQEYPEEDVKFRIAALRYHAVKSHPYLSTALFALTPYIKKIGTFAVDKRWNLYCDPEKVMNWSLEEGQAVLIHEINHVLRKHFSRCEKLQIPDEEYKVVNIAQDIPINDDLKDEGLRLPEGLFYSSTFNLPKGLAWEEYYDLLMKDHVQYLQICGPNCGDDPDCPNNKNKSDQPSQSNSNPGDSSNKSGNSKIKQPKSGSGNKTTRIHVDCGSGAHGHKQEYEEPGGIEKGEQILIIKHTAQQVKDQADKQPGSVPAGMLRWAEKYLSSRVRWDAELRASFRAGLANKQGMVDFSYQKFSRRQSVFPLTILPAIRKPTPKVSVIIDTSGSMDNTALAQCLAEVKGLLMSSGTLGEATVITLDTQVGFAKKIAHPSQIKLVGGGGTDMGRGFIYLKEKNIKSDVIVVMTDGFTPWPAEKPLAAKIIILLVGATVNNSKIPWAKVIKVDNSATEQNYDY